MFTTTLKGRPVPQLLDSPVREREDFSPVMNSFVDEIWPRGAAQFSRGPIPGVATISPVERVRNCAVWTLRQDNLDLPPHWIPDNELAVPPALLQRFPPEMVTPFVVAFNATEYSRRKGQWAVMLRNGGFLVLNISAADRPRDPSALPGGALSGLSRKEASDTVHLANELILKTARVPRLWHVVLMDLEAS
jgi:hypothetical protein